MNKTLYKLQWRKNLNTSWPFVPQNLLSSAASSHKSWVTKALANGSIKKAVTLLLNSSDTTIKENATKAIQYVIDRECYSFSDRDMNIQLQKTATRVNWKTLIYRKFNEILKPMHLYCGLVHLKLQHQNTAKHLILSTFVQLSVYWFKGGQEFLILFNML